MEHAHKYFREITKLYCKEQGCSSIRVSANTDPEEGTGGSSPLLKYHKNIGFLSNTDPELLENHKATKPVAMLGHHWHAS